MSNFASIDLDSLSTVSGGAQKDKTKGILQTAIQNDPRGLGIGAKVRSYKVTDVLGPGYVSTVSHVHVNDQWGGTGNYTCSANVDTNGLGRVDHLSCK